MCASKVPPEDSVSWKQDSGVELETEFDRWTLVFVEPRDLLGTGKRLS